MHTTQMQKDTAEIISRIHEIGPILRENAPKADRDRRVPEASIEALSSINAFGMATLKKYGGWEGGARMLLEAATTIGYYCTNSAWITIISNVSAMLPQRFPASIMDRIFAGGKPIRMSSIIVSPGGKAIRDGDGYRVSGEWPWASNVFHAEYSIGVVPIFESEDAEPELGYALLHKDQYTIKDTWFSIGMRGTGSNTIVAEDQWVPADQVVRAGVMLGPGFESMADATFHQRLTPASMFPLVIVSGPLGGAKAALDLTIAAASKRSITYSNYHPQNTSGQFAHAIGVAKGKIDSAELILKRACDIVDETAQGTTPLSLEQRAAIRNDIAHAVHNLADAMNDIAWLHGTATFAESNPIGRLWRDVNTGARHAMAASPLGYEIGGAGLLGVPLPSPMV